MSTVSPPLEAGYGSRAYRGYVLGGLVLVYLFNTLDRALVSVLNEPIKQSLGLTDFQMGLLGGPSFALLYTLLGLPIARLSEQFDRRAIISASLIIWSVMTALCGLAGELDRPVHSGIFLAVLSPIALAFLIRRLWVGLALVLVTAGAALTLVETLAGYGMLTFGLLIMSRIGVGMGEAGCLPPANSLIADYFPAERRASALSIFALGAPLGAMAAALVGAWLLGVTDWRGVFIALGIPGAVLGVIIFFSVREPPRAGAANDSSFLDVLRLVAGKPVFWHVSAAAAVAAFTGYGVGQFYFAFFSRVHALTPAEAALYFVIVAGLAGAAGTALGGILGDRFASRLKGAHAIIPGVGLVLAAPLYMAAFAAPDPALLLLALAPGAMLHYFYVGPSFALIQGLVEPRMRATAIAVFALITALVGYGLGPPLIGLLSDYATGLAFAGPGRFADTCAAAPPSPACLQAQMTGLRTAMIIGVAGYAWAGVHFLLAARHLRRDAA